MKYNFYPDFKDLIDSNRFTTISNNKWIKCSLKKDCQPKRKINFLLIVFFKQQAKIRRFQNLNFKKIINNFIHLYKHVASMSCVKLNHEETISNKSIQKDVEDVRDYGGIRD